MVAYSFAPQFADQVASLTKRQTVRADRKRHARPGEPVQLYAGMRTRQCRKLVDIDPVYVDVRPIEIDFYCDWLDNHPQWSAYICYLSIDGKALTDAEIEAFAEADGFNPDRLNDGLSARRMAKFWAKHHGLGGFAGVVINWEPSHG